MRGIITLTVLALAATMALSGCDDDSGVRGRSFTIDPGRATLSFESKTLILRAVGGEPPYVWSVSDPTLGAVSSDSHTVTYTRTPLVGVNTVRVVDGQGWKAEMVVYQRAEEE